MSCQVMTLKEGPKHCHTKSMILSLSQLQQDFTLTNYLKVINIVN